MKITFTYAPGDFSSFFRRRFAQSLLRVIPILVVLIVVSEVPNALAYGTVSISGILIGALYGLPALVVLYFLMPWIARKQTYENPLFQGVYTIEIGADGVGTRTTLHQSLYSWKAVRRIDADRANIYIYLLSTAAVILPKRALAGVGEADRFFNTASAYLRGDVVTPVAEDSGSWPPSPNL